MTLAIVCALLVGVGAAAMTGVLRERITSSPRRPRATRARVVRHLPVRAAAGLLLACVGYFVTGWPVAAIWLGVAGLTLPDMMGVGRRRSAAIARIEAIAAWTESLRDQVRAGADVMQAVQAGSGRAPAAIAPAVGRLAIRLRREPPATALAMFSTELADTTADMVAAALTLAFTQPARRLADLLDAAANAAREQAAMRLRVERDRARTRTVARATGAVVAVWVVVVYLISRAYFAAYDDASGQTVLLVAGSCFAAGFALLGRLDRLPETPRLHLAERSGRMAAP